ncbi:sigma 54-interacting transcriptional regulator [Eubacterium ramulus]
MEKIAYIVPNEKWIPVIEDCIAGTRGFYRVDVQTIDVMHIQSEYRRLSREGYGVIIARGGTYLELSRRSGAARVMEVRVRTTDVLVAIKKSQEYYRGKIYVGLHEKVAIDFEKTLSLYNFPVSVFRYVTTVDLKERVDEIPESNVLVLTSGIVADTTDREDLMFEQLGIGDEAVREVVERAQDYLRQRQADDQQINLLESILLNVEEGIVVFDRNMKIQELNRRAQKLLGITVDDALGKKISNFVKDCSPEMLHKLWENQQITFLYQKNHKTLNVVVSQFRYYQDEDRFIMTIQDVTKIQDEERAIRRKLAQKGLVANYTFSDILTAETSMKRLLEKAKTVSAYEGNVLIYGANGTGKELLAQSIHNASLRANGPFVAVNCAALAESLLESELFGYVGGAFTGAKKEGKAGLFELAHEGTIFLDEINSMPLGLQAKILRVIQQQEVMRVGSDYVVPINVRVIAASNEPMRERINRGEFRQDLYFRISTFELNLPSMNERPKDVLYLFRHYLAEFENCPESDITLPEEFVELLQTHNWWGNVREIRSTALRYHAFHGDNSGGEILKNEDVEESLVDDDFKINLSELNKTVEELVITSMLNKNMKKTDIANALGISRQALYKKLNS